MPAVPTAPKPIPWAELWTTIAQVAGARGPQARADRAAAAAAAQAGYRAALLTLTFEHGTEVGCHGLTAEETARFRNEAHRASPAERRANRAAMMQQAWPGTEICFVEQATDTWNVVETPPARRVDEPGDWQPADALFLQVRTADGRDVGLLSLDQPLDGQRPVPAQAPRLEVAQRLLAVAATLIEEAQVAAQAALAEGRLIQAQKLEVLGELTCEVAHDFNNLLAAINGYADLAELEGPGEPVAGYMRAIMEACNQGATLSHRLLDFGAPGDSGPVRDLGKFLVESETLLGRLAGRGCGVRVTVEDPTLPLAVDETVLTQILLNLVVNARQAMPQGGMINVRARRLVERDTQFAELEVEDPGTGMSEEVQARVFEPFYTTKAEGTGLGLATVRRLVYQAGGRVRIDSELGAGTIVRVDLPLG